MEKYNPDEAIACLQRTLEIKPDNPDYVTTI